MSMSKDVSLQVDAFIARLRRRQTVGSFNVAIESAKILHNVVSGSRWPDQDHLIDLLQHVGRRLIAAQPGEIAVANAVRRVLNIVREEAVELLGGDGDGEDGDATPPPAMSPGAAAGSATATGAARPAPSALTLGFANAAAMFQRPASASSSGMSSPMPGSPARGLETPRAPIVSYMLRDLSAPAETKLPLPENPKEFREQLRAGVKQAILDMIDDFLHSGPHIASQALQHVHPNDRVLTFGWSKTVLEFLKEAGKLRKFQVMVVEAAPACSGHQMAVELATAGIDTTLVTDAAVLALMPKVDKIILGAHAVTADGGMIATAGSLLVAEVAKACKRPIIVCSGMYKVSPLGLMQQQEVLSLNSCPNGVYDFEEGDVVERVEVVNPHYDFVPAELISVLVTNMGTHPPSYMSHMLDDVYSKLDLVI